MITLNDILDSIIKILKTNFPKMDVVTDTNNILEDNDGIYVEATYSMDVLTNKFINSREIIVSLTYVPESESSRRELNELADKLNEIFASFFYAKDKKLIIKSTFPTFLVDEHGHYLVYEIRSDYMAPRVSWEENEKMSEVETEIIQNVENVEIKS